MLKLIVSGAFLYIAAFVLMFGIVFWPMFENLMFGGDFF